MILVMAGKKSSGKSTACKYIAGLVLRHRGLIKDFTIDGVNLVVTANVNYKDKVMEETFPFDIKRRDYDFLKYAQNMIYPHVKIFSFADPLKEFLHKMFGVPFESLYGTDEQKNEPTKVLWDNILKLLSPQLKKKYADKKGTYASCRELMQIFGTEVCRTLYEDCHVEACFNDIYTDSSSLSLVDDARFPNEVHCSSKSGAKVIKLCNQLEEGFHESETAIDGLPESDFDYIIPESTLDEKHRHIHIALTQFGLSYLL